MSILEMRKQEVILLFENLWDIDNNEMGEKDFFEFIKRANRDLKRNQRFGLVKQAIAMMKGENNEPE